MSYRAPFLFLSVLLLVKAILVVFFILYGYVGLGPDEAQYWTWSQDLDWGYYSKPPGIAWLIWIGCQLFGNTELGVRSGAVLIGSLLPLAIFQCARVSQLKPRVCFWAGILMAFSPLGILSTFLAITDGGLVLFWTLANLLIVDALKRETPLSIFWLGLMIIGGALFKWPIYFFWAVALVTTYFYPTLRISFWKWGAGILFSLLGLLPSVIWNYRHEWATFRHVFSTIKGSPQAMGYQGNFFSFFSEQLLILSPILGILLIWAFSTLFTNPREDKPIKWCGWCSLIILGIACFMALFQKMQGNWAIFAYPAAILFLSAVALENGRVKPWLQGGLGVGLVLSSFGLSIPFLQAHQTFIQLPYAFNPFRHNVGWEKLESLLKDEGYDPQEHFLFGDKYQMSSLLSFYGEGQKRAYFLNLHHIRKNQFSFWPQMRDEQLNKTGFYVLVENIPHLFKDQESRIQKLKELLSPHFKEVEWVGVRPLFFNQGKEVKGAFLFICKEYQEIHLDSPDLY